MMVSESKAHALLLMTRPARVLVPARVTVPEESVVMTVDGSMVAPARWTKSALESVRPPAGRLAP